MTALGMMALHLRIAEFKFTHNSIICNRLPDSEIIFGIDIQKKFSISMHGTKKQIVIYKEMGKHICETVNRRPQLALSNNHLKYCQDTIVLYQLKSQDRQLRTIWLISSLMKIQQKEGTPMYTLLMAFMSNYTIIQLYKQTH